MRAFGTREADQRDVWQDIDEKLDGAGAAEFPPPPVPGTRIIVPIRTKAVLIEEGRRQKNCAADYAKRIADGKMAICRVLSPERCTLSLRVSRGEWVFDQLKAARNAPVSPATERAVAEWLAGSHIIHVPRRRHRRQ